MALDRAVDRSCQRAILANFKRNQIVLDEVNLSADANLLLSGIAKISCLECAQSASNRGAAGARSDPGVSLSVRQPITLSMRCL